MAEEISTSSAAENRDGRDISGNGREGTTAAGVESGGWVLLEEGDLKGTTIVVDPLSGSVVSLSTRHCKESDRWKDAMPSLDKYLTIQSLDLHNSRYISHLDESVCRLSNLRKLALSNCEQLVTLPDSIGRLRNLHEVRSLPSFLYLFLFFLFHTFTLTSTPPPVLSKIFRSSYLRIPRAFLRFRNRLAS